MARMAEKETQIPNGWGKDGLSGFLQGAYENNVLTFQYYSRVFDILMEIERLFGTLNRKVRFPKNVLSPSFIARSWYAWRAAVRLVTSGQVVESYSVMRASLECALYAHFISTDDSRTEVWLRRGTCEDATKQAKNMFTARAVKDAVTGRDPGLGAEVERLYVATIDNGGHPNVAGHIAAAHWSTEEVTIQDMIPGTDQWKVALRDCWDIGLCDLRICKLMLGDGFCKKLSEDLDALCKRIDEGNTKANDDSG